MQEVLQLYIHIDIVPFVAFTTDAEGAVDLMDGAAVKTAFRIGIFFCCEYLRYY